MPALTKGEYCNEEVLEKIRNSLFASTIPSIMSGIWPFGEMSSLGLVTAQQRSNQARARLIKAATAVSQRTPTLIVMDDFDYYVDPKEKQMHFDVDKVVVSFMLYKSYQSIATRTIEVPIIPIESGDGKVTIRDVSRDATHAVNRMRSLVENMIFSKLAEEEEIKVKVKEGVKEGIAKNDVKVSENWRLQNEITELKKTIARKECQLEGMIKQGSNGSWEPNPEGEDHPTQL